MASMRNILEFLANFTFSSPVVTFLRSQIAFNIQALRRVNIFCSKVYVEWVWYCCRTAVLTSFVSVFESERSQNTSVNRFNYKPLIRSDHRIKEMSLKLDFPVLLLTSYNVIRDANRFQLNNVNECVPSVFYSFPTVCFLYTMRWLFKRSIVHVHKSYCSG